MTWITRERRKIDRIACPWLVSRLVDPSPEVLYIPASEVDRVADESGAIPYDVPRADLGHHGERCSFDAFVSCFAIADPAIAKLAQIVRAADTGKPGLAKEAEGPLWPFRAGYRSTFRTTTRCARAGWTCMTPSTPPAAAT